MISLFSNRSTQAFVIAVFSFRYTLPETLSSVWMIVLSVSLIFFCLNETRNPPSFIKHSFKKDSSASVLISLYLLLFLSCLSFHKKERFRVLSSDSSLMLEDPHFLISSSD